MPKSKKIKISCKYTDSVAIDDLIEFQGELKTINKEELKKLKESILKYGFSFPIFIWKNKILDGHQRLEAIKELTDNGYEIKDNVIPVVNIEAKNEKEAAEKLLLINSRYATIDQGGFEVFAHDMNINLSEMIPLIELPEIILSPIGETDYEKEWNGMPEFENEEIDVYHSIKVNFNSEDDLLNFSKLIGQTVTDKTISIYYPKQEREDIKSMYYKSES